MSRPTPERPVPDDLPRRADYGQGSYRRCIVVEAGPGRGRGELADDFHHFAATLDHRDGVVTAVHAEGIRVPWTTCPGAAVPLERLVGARIDRSLPTVARNADPRAQCTHWYDAACLAIVHAARHIEGGAAKRRYDVVLPDRVAGRTRPILDRDGTRLLDWQIEGWQVVEADPGIFSGVGLRGADWSRLLGHALEDDLVEAALVMRRAVFIGLGRQYDFERIERATRFAPVVGAACHTFGPEHLDAARKLPDTVRDFHHEPERILERDPSAR